MRGRNTTRLAAALALLGLILTLPASLSSAATRRPLRDVLATATVPAWPVDSAARPRPAALRAMVRGSARRYASAGAGFQLLSDHYGAAQVESVAATLRSLDHGPELSQLVVYVATPAEIREACGATVVACYVPDEGKMVVSGVDRPIAGVPRDFAIAHEYGHHIVNTRQGSTLPALEGGTSRWATYERVCQLTRSGRLFPGDQGAHYWENPEEAFAQSYADLNRPNAAVSWQYTPLLQPTIASLAKIHADVNRPWSGPTTFSWDGSVSAAPEPVATGKSGPLPGGDRAAATVDGGAAIGPGRAVGDLAWVDSRLLRTPLDGPVSVSLQAPPGAALALVLRDPAAGRVLSRASTDSSGAAALTYPNCGHAALRLEVRATQADATFHTTISRP